MSLSDFFLKEPWTVFKKRVKRLQTCEIRIWEWSISGCSDTIPHTNNCMGSFESSSAVSLPSLVSVSSYCHKRRQALATTSHHEGWVSCCMLFTYLKLFKAEHRGTHLLSSSECVIPKVAWSWRRTSLMISSFFSFEVTNQMVAFSAFLDLF